MKFCDDELNFLELFDGFKTIYDKFDSIENVSVLQGIALAREIKEELDTFTERVALIGVKSIICEVLSHYDIDSQIKEVEDYLTKLFTEFTDLDDQIANITKDGFDTLEEVENAVAPIFDNFISSKEDIEKMVDNKLADLFSPLIELGASEQGIKEALEEVEFNDSPTQYIIDVFTRIADDTLQTLN